MNTVMEHDLEEGVIIGEEGKKIARGALEDVAVGKETDNLLNYGQEIQIEKIREDSDVQVDSKESKFWEELSSDGWK
ncbi:hypothetical protein PVK06_016759 [Gossypium arboreum]|uniref:Uncharacterized protein n=1 Tax=Gossypium arboreum TaxID=29729 RepID=A0ABR0Q1C8_GOSAR|nr:hypothetical protein PVK06_016759 [Gossypium arboreum]